MANPTDPAFLAGFDAAAFRQAITSTMEMGLPDDVGERATFRWKVDRTFSASDRGGNPYDLSATPVTEEEHDDVLIPVAVEFEDRRADGSPLGQFENPRAVLTVLDTHYEDIDGATQVLLTGNTYVIDYVAPSFGLGDVTVYQLYLTAVDES